MGLHTTICIVAAPRRDARKRTSMTVRLSIFGFLLGALLVPGCSGSDGTPTTTSPSPLLTTASAGAADADDLMGGSGMRGPGAGGTVSGLSGSCPNLAFSLDGRGGSAHVITNGSTTFDGGACADVKNGAHAGAVGERQADGTLVAARVRIGEPHGGPRPPGPPGDGPHGPGAGGVVSGLSGACPNLSFTVTDRNNTPKRVRTNSATVFEGKACGAIVSGDHAGARGALQTDGSILADHVRVGPPPPRR